MSAATPHLDLGDPAFSGRSHEVVEARRSHWYATTDNGVVVLRHGHVKRLLTDRRLRQGTYARPAQVGIVEGALPRWWANIMLTQEGADHARLRRLLNPIFSLRSIARRTSIFEELTDELLAGFAPKGECEFVSEFALPYAARVLAKLLGSPDESWPELARWASDLALIFSADVPAALPRIELAISEIELWADELVEHRRRRAGDDLTSELLAMVGPDGGLRDDELRSTLGALVFGGIQTTSTQLGLAICTFAEHLSQWSLLGDDPRLAPAAVEELLRFNSTITMVSRIAVSDIEIDGLTIEQGTPVTLLTESANNDPEAMGPPNFDITASRAKHLAFGGGPHHCLGHVVARSDLGVALPRLAAAMRDLHFRAPADYVAYRGSLIPVALPIGFRSEPSHK